ncbi:hypothetical protein KAFR_0D01700 [Kazachstania africana CBS 2517]|uniref:CAF1B/HIR1 beta-propeller domain-containing protein n=1 Tax=Kazachstania africana (strain ATCC 22294 / BCRC 22015 / CBS 2517 / CECT 1963 / NBRC 1671 / NRRL Y-8276) TaxID=1071382 RepID=H2ATW7_KAZAF|nr:hypothetical protein KAFR_0D01700 [Kazachstania africana CBS 2517]CCF57817.1 hypothetical protein KAFR_0D01700 [Kazachstania africana CBS 2517]
MEASNLQIYWHESQPVYSLCFQPNYDTSNTTKKLFTAGGDNKIRAWNLELIESPNQGSKQIKKVDTIDFLSSLQQHEQAVNVVRFNSDGTVLASAGDDGQIILWKRNDAEAKPVPSTFGASESDGEFKESWFVWKRLKSSSNSEIYDLSWSPNDKYVVCGCMDNCIRIFNIETAQCVSNIRDHNHYVQGVTWDPLNEYILSQSADRSVNIYEIIFNNTKDEINGLKLKNRIVKGELPKRGLNSDGTKTLDLSSMKSSYLFHNETLPSFFRRLTLSPCGNLLCIPAGIFKTSENALPAGSSKESGSGMNNPEVSNSVYIYTRGALKQNNGIKPAIALPYLGKAAIVVSFNPNFYQSTEDKKAYIDVPYKLVFAIATSNEVLIYDTESIEPISIVGNLHYTPLTDLSWSQDGAMLMVSSTDGFCSYISVDSELFGIKLSEEKRKEYLNNGLKSSNDSLEDSTYKEGKLSTTENTTRTDIVNILPVKRKNPSNAQDTSSPSSVNTNLEKSTLENDDGKVEEGSPANAKKRIQPTLITL